MSWPNLEFTSADTAFFFYGSAVLCAYIAAAVTTPMPPASPQQARQTPPAHVWRPMVALPADRPVPARSSDTLASAGRAGNDASDGREPCAIAQLPLDPSVPVSMAGCATAMPATASMSMPSMPAATMYAVPAATFGSRD